MEAPLKRSRACDACHSIKIKCELGSSGGDLPCKRCARLGKTCVVSPHKRQKDRVAELEAQVEALTKLLKSQNIHVDGQQPSRTSEVSAESLLTATTSTSSAGGNVSLFSNSVGNGSHSSINKRRRIEEQCSNDESAVSQNEANLGPSSKLVEMDNVVEIATQRQLFEKYFTQMMTTFALVPLRDDTDYDSMRKERPILLHAVLYAACQGELAIEVQDEVCKIMTDQFTLSNAAKSIDLVEAMQIASVWHRNPKSHTTIESPTMVKLAMDVAKEIGISPASNLSHFKPVGARFHGDSVEAWRTWLVCCLLCAVNSTIWRIVSPVSWDVFEDLLMVKLEYWPYGSKSEQRNDRLLTQYVRAEKMCERIASQHHFFDLETIVDVIDPETQNTMALGRNLVTDWKAQIPPNFVTPMLKFWEHIALLYTYECVLHTRTNKRSFGAPFVTERLSVTDFPAPAVVTQKHIDALHALRDNAQALLDWFLDLDLVTIMSLPPLLFIARALYSEWILSKLYIATTAPGNTFGDFVDSKSLKLDEYLESMIQLSGRVREVDFRCGTARILGGATRRREWLWNYRATQEQRSQSILQQQVSTLSSPPDCEHPGVTGDSVTGKPWQLQQLQPVSHGADDQPEIYHNAQYNHLTATKSSSDDYSREIWGYGGSDSAEDYGSLLLSIDPQLLHVLDDFAPDS